MSPVKSSTHLKVLVSSYKPVVLVYVKYIACSLLIKPSGKGMPEQEFILFQDVLSVAFSADNRQIVSGSRDKTIKVS